MSRGRSSFCDELTSLGARSKAAVSRVIGDPQVLILFCFSLPCQRHWKPLDQCPRFKELSAFQGLKTSNTSKLVLSWSPCSGQRQALLCCVAKRCLFLKQQVSQGRTGLPSRCNRVTEAVLRAGRGPGTIRLEPHAFPGVFSCVKSQTPQNPSPLPALPVNSTLKKTAR